MQLYLIFLQPLKHGIFSGLTVFISLMDTKNKSLAHFASITSLFLCSGREFQGILLLLLCVERKKKSFRLERANWDSIGWLLFFLVFRILHSPTYCFCVCVCARSVTESCPTLWDVIDCSPPVSSVPGILQARFMEWVGCHFLLQGIFAQEPNACLWNWI